MRAVVLETLATCFEKCLSDHWGGDEQYSTLIHMDHICRTANWRSRNFITTTDETFGTLVARSALCLIPLRELNTQPNNYHCQCSCYKNVQLQVGVAS
jgi:hypothetical protein